MIARSRWRLGAMILALLAFGMAAAHSGEGGAASAWLLGGWLSHVGSMTFFWMGVGLVLLAAWRRGGT